MDQPVLQIRMLGGFSLTLDGLQVDDGGNRARKIWLLLAYMIYNRSRQISQSELIGLLWREDEQGGDPGNALRAMLHRARGVLGGLGPAGRGLIVSRRGSCSWNPAHPVELDIDEFERLCRAAASAAQEDGGDAQLELCLRALALYEGDFLSRLSTEAWVRPIAAYYHNLYLTAAQTACALLEARRRYEEAAWICRRALRVESFSEEFYLHLMQNLLALGRQQETVAVYEEMSELFLSNFSIMPPQEIRDLYYEACRTVNDRAVPLEVVRDQLREPVSEGGPLVCEYDFFRAIYYSMSRLIVRSGQTVHLGQISVIGRDGKEIPRRSLDRAMENLEVQIRASLRRCDVVARCSVSQYVMLLLQANYENSCRVLERIIRSFERQFPHSPAALRYAVQPLEVNY